MKKDLEQIVADYYSRKLQEHGPTPSGVDWNSAESQELRFKMLSHVIASDSGFSIADIGCGYGAFFDYLKGRYSDVTYIGCDVSTLMVEAASARISSPNSTFTVGTGPEALVDYAVASGIFNVKLNSEANQWQSYMSQTLEEMNLSAHKGFAFNCLTSYSDPDRQRADLYYGDPCQWFDFCMKNFSRNVALMHDYGLYEFTIVVRK